MRNTIMSVAVKVSQGRSKEDRYTVETTGNIKFYAVYDGHGGSAPKEEYVHKRHVVRYLQENLHKKLITSIIENSETDVNDVITKVFIEIDSYLYEEGYCHGSTASVVLVTDSHIYQINVGDSRSIIFSTEGIISETKDDDPSEEEERIKKAGGYVAKGKKISRVNGKLAMSRGFGDFENKMVRNVYSPEGPISVIPNIIITPRASEQYIVIGSDGLFEHISSKKMVDIIGGQIKTLKFDPEFECSMAVSSARSWTNDDITMILVRIE